MMRNSQHIRGLDWISKRDKKRRTVTPTDIISVLLVLVICSAGCSNRFFDPTQIGRFRPVPAENVILDSLGVADETPMIWEGAEEPQPIDVMAFETDYVLGTGDIVMVSIFELLQEGLMFADQYIINETGKISILEVGTVEAAGLTESQLEEEIKQILTPNILKDPSVTVILTRSERRSYSILGDGVPRPSRYAIPRYDFRLTDALATAGGISSFNISYIYVSRAVTGTEPVEQEAAGGDAPWQAQPEQPEEATEAERQMLEMITPRTQRQRAENRLVITSAEITVDEELTEAALPEGFNFTPSGRSRRLTDDTEIIDEPINSENIGQIEWVFKNGKWVPVQTAPPPAPPAADAKVKVKQKVLQQKKTVEPLIKKIPADLRLEQIGTGGVQRRVIKIPADSLASGDPRYNIVIRPGDTIHVPVDIIGEFCIMGNINRRGYIPIVGRRLTLKMAIAAAGGLGPLAWPQRCEVTRRLGWNREETVMVDLEKIARGEQPDFFIKPDDLINVGTHATSMWRAVLRNSFRATYGFGFLYDRNFADRDYGTRRPIPSWLF